MVMELGIKRGIRNMLGRSAPGRSRPSREAIDPHSRPKP